MNRKNFRTGKYRGPIFKINRKIINFDEDRDHQQEEAMLARESEIGKPGCFGLRPIVKRKKAERRNDPKVENRYLTESLLANPYYMMRVSEEDSEMTEESSTKLVSEMTESEIRTDLLRRSSKTFFERNDLQSSRSLSMFDCWENDKTPEEWISLCQQDPENEHAHCPFYRKEK